LNSAVREVLQLSKLLRVFEIADSEEQAVASWGAKSTASRNQAVNVMELAAQIGGSVTDGLAYLGGLASLAGRAAYFTFVAPFRGKPLRLRRSVSQAMQVSVRALPILSLITFFIGLILALQSAYELRRLGALNYVANAVAISMTRELG